LDQRLDSLRTNIKELYAGFKLAFGIFFGIQHAATDIDDIIIQPDGHGNDMAGIDGTMGFQKDTGLGDIQCPTHALGALFTFFVIMNVIYQV